MAEGMKKTCDGNCLTCGINQRSYCAAQMAFYTQNELSEIKAYLMKKDDYIVNPTARSNEALKTQENGIEEDLA